MMTHWQGWLYLVAALLPLAAFLIQVLGLRLLKHRTAWVATVCIFASLVLSLTGFGFYLAATHGMPSHAIAPDVIEEASPAPLPHEPVAWSASIAWASLGANLGGEPGPLVIPFSVRVDSLTVLMFVMVTFIATLIHVYSISYMRGDSRYPRFFAYLSLFCFSMLGLVLAGNVFLVFIFWELVGLCSYLLIGFWYEEKANTNAANKAFLVNRIGDVGMLVGLGLLWTYFGSFDLHDLNQALASPLIREYDGLRRITASIAGDRFPVLVDGVSHTIPYWALVVAGLGIFAGCVGKSAQFPLHVWLPDAMAGPTPVSALIHAATMVAAGVYLVGRFYPLFTHEVLLFIAYTGGLTLLLAASIALVQSDYKKVLAYSTVSQLGFMMLGLGVGGWAAGLFHLFTHAFFKALLFLGAGSVHHSVHTYDMSALGGLRRKLPITANTMLVATLAISGVPFLSGFYSKDAILAAATAFVRAHPQHFLLLVIPLVGACLTGLYMFRMWFKLFTGPVPSGSPASHAHESGPLITIPLILLAIPTVAVGWPWVVAPLIQEPVLEGWLRYGDPLPRLEPTHTAYFAFGASLLVATLGISLAALFYGPPGWRAFNAPRLARQFAPIDAFLRNKWYLDALYQALLVQPVLALAALASTIDRHLIDGLIHRMARGTVALSRLDGHFDLRILDGLVNRVAQILYRVGDFARRWQTGQIRGYLMGMSLALVLLSLGVYFWILG